MNFFSVLESLVAFFQREKCRFAIIGAFALHAYGLSRATGDLDFIVDSACQSKCLEFLESIGYETLYVSSGYSNHLHPMPAMGRIDFVYVAGVTAAKLFDNAKQVLTLNQGAMTLPVPKPEHLVAMKLFAMKNDPARAFQEMADIHYLLMLPEINEEETRQYFIKYGFQEQYEAIKGKRDF